MSNIAVYTITRDRLDYTKKSFDSLATKAGTTYDHYVWDNGSTDGTADWLRDQDGLRVYGGDLNVGQHVAANVMLKEIRAKSYDYIVRFDNDCYIRTKRILSRMVEASRVLEDKTILSPDIIGLKHPVERFAYKDEGKYNFGFVEILGGICRLHPTKLWGDFTFDVRHPMGIGDASQVSKWAVANNVPMAYVENLKVTHGKSTRDQERDIPDYFNDHYSLQRYPYVPVL